MKILIVITQGKIGGATNFVFYLAKGLKEKDVKIQVGFGQGEYLKEKLEKENIPFVNFKWLKRTYNPLANLFFIFEIKNFLDKEIFDIVHFNSTNALFGVIGAKLSKNKPKTVFTFHGLSILDPNFKKFFPLKIIYWLIFKFLLYFVDIPIFVCQSNLEIARKIKLTKNGIVIYNGIPKPEFFDKGLSKKFFEEKTKTELKNKFIIGSIGRLDYSKNYQFLINIFPEILKIKKEAVLIIVGQGSEKKKLENLIEKLSLQEKIFLIGEIKSASKYLKGFDLFVLPSRYEGLSITLIEASFAQILVLASDVGGNEKIIGKESVYKFNEKKEFLEKLKKNKVPQIKKGLFSLQRMIENYFKIYSRSN